MDFDELDDEIDARIAAGDTAGITISSTREKADLKEFKVGSGQPGMTPMPRDHRLPLDPGYSAKIRNVMKQQTCLRAFIFYGPGGEADRLTPILQQMPDYLEVAVFEFPGHGLRYAEPAAEDLDALVEDAFQGIKPALEEVKEGGEFEGAPFAFIGHSVGCQILAMLGQKALMIYGLSPSFVIILDRAPLKYPLLSLEGQEMLTSNPKEVLKALNFEELENLDKDMWIKDLQLDCEGKVNAHKFDCDVLVLKPKLTKIVDQMGKETKSIYSMATIQIEGTNERLHLPVEPNMVVKDVLQMLASAFDEGPNKVQLSAKSESGQTLQDTNPVGAKLIVQGLKDFKNPRFPWPHPVAIIGAGFVGIKMGMQYMVNKNENFVMFDRHERAGGIAWIDSATKHSRIQTDFAAFNIWWGQQFVKTGDGGWGSNPNAGGRAQFSASFKGTGAGTGVDYNPIREQVIGQLNYAAKEYGFADKIQYQANIAKLEIEGQPDAEDRSYKLTVEKPNATNEAKVSVVYHFAGAYDNNRIIDYPGEDTFGGQIGYGMGNGQGGLFVWDDGRMTGARAAILGNGAFAVENIRSCAEHGAAKVYVVTRRKSLLCPRIPCWFCHQGPAPTPAWLLLDMFKPMYEATGCGDPYGYYAVNANKSHTFATLSQSSRFGIGDVSFLCHAYGLLEYKVDTLERCSPNTLHLTSGEKLEDMQHIIKALGLLGDPTIDKLHSITHMVSNMVNGDWRRIITADATGMHASNFTTFSAGPGACQFTKQWYYLHNHPWEMREALKNGLLTAVPQHVKSSTQPDQPVYMYNVQYAMASGNMFVQFFPSLWSIAGDEDNYFYCLVHSMHPTTKYLDYCKADWDRYQKMFKERPEWADQKEVPFPYTMEMIDEWYKVYNKAVNRQTSSAGPGDEVREQVVKGYEDIVRNINTKMIPTLIKELKFFKRRTAAHDPFLLASAAEVYPLRKRFLNSGPDSALYFEDSQYEEWGMWTAQGFDCSTVEVDGDSNGLLLNMETWGHILAKLETVKAKVCGPGEIAKVGLDDLLGR